MPDIQPAADIAVTFALPEEGKDFVAKLRGMRVVQGGTLPVITGELLARRIAVCHTGVGAESCNTRIAAFLQEHRPAKLVSSGFAGGLDPALQVGDVVVAANFCSPEMLAKASLQQIFQGAMTTEKHVAETVAEKAALFSQTGASAVDMETAIIFGQCSQRGIPMLSLRGISDSAADDLPVSFSIWFDAAKQKPRVGALLWELATHPAKIPRFAKFVRGISLARARLTEALAALVATL